MTKNIFYISILFYFVIQISCDTKKKAEYTEQDILDELDLAYKGIVSPQFPKILSPNIGYNFFLDLEHGYNEAAGSYIHLFADSLNWAVVFEKSGYQNRGGQAEIELIYIGNCINYPEDKYVERSYLTNVSNIILIDEDEYKRIADTNQIEMICKDVDTVLVRGISVRIKQDADLQMSYGDVIRYIFDNQPEVLRASDREICKCFCADLPKLMTLNEFHYSSWATRDNLPSKQELYQQIAKILVTRDTSNYKPILPPNNHWSNWESGNL